MYVFPHCLLRILSCIHDVVVTTGNLDESLIFIELSSSCYYMGNRPVNERCTKHPTPFKLKYFWSDYFACKIKINVPVKNCISLFLSCIYQVYFC